MFIVPRRNLFQRALNRAGRPFGLFPFPVAFESSLPVAAGRDNTAKATFDAIYESNYWQSPESGSGAGSEMVATDRYRPQLRQALTEFHITSMFDAPCGDLNWMPSVLADVDIAYIGGDVADHALVAARAAHPDLDTRLFDICRDAFPDVDLWHCRDTLFHLSFDMIWQALRQAAKAEIKYAAITTHRARLLRNLDIVTGGFRLLDLTRPPFNLPRPIRYMADHGPGEMPRYVGLWRMDDIRAAAAD